MKSTAEFESWLDNMLRDAKDKLHITDRLIAYVLLREGINYYLKQITEGEYGIRPTEKHN